MHAKNSKNIKSTVGARLLFNRAEKEARKEQRQQRVQRQREEKENKRLERIYQREELHQRRLQRIDQEVERRIYELNSTRKSYEKSVDKIFKDGEKRRRKWEERELKYQQKQREK